MKGETNRRTDRQMDEQSLRNTDTEINKKAGDGLNGKADRQIERENKEDAR